MSVVIVGGNECMVRSTLNETKGKDIKIVRCHTSSASALRSILNEHA